MGTALEMKIWLLEISRNPYKTVLYINAVKLLELILYNHDITVCWFTAENYNMQLQIINSFQSVNDYKLNQSVLLDL